MQPDLTIRLNAAEDRLKHLNPEQLRAVLHQSGPALVIAGAGTGKTRVITERIAHLLNQNTCKHDEILALTFTEKAAAEMEERLDVLMPIGYEAINVSTFHSFCEKLLRQFGIDIGISPNFQILEGVQQWQFMRENLFEFDLSYYRPLGNPTKFIDALVSHFSRLKEELISPKAYLDYSEALSARSQTKDEIVEVKRIQELAKAYEQYQKLLEENSYLDFSDLQHKAVQLLEDRPNILKYLQKRFQYLLVDEYQDTNISQNRLCDLLAGQHKNLMVVGDDDQSIYKFRGAAISNILQYEEKYPNLQKFVLTRNYRSNQRILDFSYKSIQLNNPDRLEVKSAVNKQLTALAPGKDDAIVLTHCTTLEQEVEFVVEQIGKAEVPLSEVALLVRANHYAQPFIEAFRKANIPYQFLSERGLYDKPEIKDLITFLRILSNPTDDISFYQVLRFPHWNLSMETIAKLVTDAKQKYSSVWGQVKSHPECRLLKETVEDCLQFSKTHTVGETLYRFTESIKLYEQLLADGTIEAEEKITNIATFFSKIRDYERTNDLKTVIDFVSYLDLALESGENPSAKFDVAGMDGVQISTIHGVKGLEFNTVFLANLVNRRFPTDNRRDLIPLPDELIHEILSESDVHTQEERRLFYVACTRAKEKLYLLHSDYYSPSSSKKPRVNKRSRFIDEIVDQVTITQVEKTSEGVEQFLKPQVSGLKPQVSSDTKQDPITRFSYSQLSTYKSCPRQYQYAYLYKIPQPPSGALSFGISLHNTLLAFYRLVTQTKQASLFTEFEEDLSLEKLLGFYEEKWMSQGYESRQHMESAKVRGKEILELFYGHFKERVPQIEFLEKGFKLKVGDYTLSGRIDRADKLDDGTLEIIDYKTGRSKSQSQVDKDLQLQIYAMATKECLNKPSSKMTLYFLDDDLKVSTEPDDKQIEKVKQEIIETADQINKGNFSPTPNKMACKYCAYRGICDSAI